MTEKQLKDSLNNLLLELNNLGDAKSYKAILAKAVQLGMDYQKQKIKQGIDIVFKEL